MATTSRNSEDDENFLGTTTARIVTARDDFFDFMKSYSRDFDDYGKARENWDEPWDCLHSYFIEWVRDRVKWHGSWVEENEVRYPVGYCPPGTAEFEEFNRLLPYVLLAVVDQALRYPELLQASRATGVGSGSELANRSIKFLLQSRHDREAARKLPKYDDKDDESIMRLLLEPYPPIVSIS